MHSTRSPGVGTVIRRRDGVDAVRLTRTDDGSNQVRQILESTLVAASAADRVRAAAIRLALAAEGRRTVTSRVTLRDDQTNVFTDMVNYFNAAADHLAKNPTISFPYGRFIQPPRTGKTVIIGETISGAAITATVVVPSQDLVNQVARKLREQLPTVPVGVYYGEAKEAVSGGVNVVTYQILWQHSLNGKLPESIRRSTVVFCDEAHRAMSEARMESLRTAFEPGALRIACTATPDWSERRTLATHFSHLIHEITLQEAVTLDLFAPLKVQVLSVSVDGSSLRTLGGDFDSEKLGRIMSEAPVLEAARVLRYVVDDNAKTPALICCRTVQQARDVHDYLCQNRPAGSPKPALIIGDDPDKKGRQQRLDDFEAGKIDTLVNVGVLIEGWDSARCKLEIDLDPSLSEVRAKQKYFRVMTKDGAKVARIYVVLPQNLREIPLLPQVLFGNSIELHGFDEWLARQPKKPAKRVATPATRARQFKLEGTRMNTRLLLSFDSTAQRLNPKSLSQIREVIQSMVAASPAGSLIFGNFLQRSFSHPLFSGFGIHLLRYCGVRRKLDHYLAFMTKVFPDQAADRLLKKFDLEQGELPSCEEDAWRLQAAVESGLHGDSPADGWRALFGPDEDDTTLEDDYDRRLSLARLLGKIRHMLGERHQNVISRRFGFESNSDEQTLAEVGKGMRLSRTRVSQIEREAMLKLREVLAEQELMNVPVGANDFMPFVAPYRGRYLSVICLNRSVYQLTWQGQCWYYTDPPMYLDEPGTRGVFVQRYSPTRYVRWHPEL